MSETNKNQITEGDKFSKIFFYGVPWTIPVIVTLLTYLFRPMTEAANLVWLPLLIIYWATIWGFTMLYRFKKGGVFDKERYKLTLKLQGKYLWLQYIVTYGPLIYSIPLFIWNYVINASMTANMYLALIIVSIVNGPSEETFWRACMEDAGKNAGVSEKGRLIFAPIVFSFWHTAFVIHLFPWDADWIWAWLGVLAMTWSSGIIWHWVMQRSGRLIPQTIYHSCANFFNILPLMLVTVLQIYF